MFTVIIKPPPPKDHVIIVTRINNFIIFSLEEGEEDQVLDVFLDKNRTYLHKQDKILHQYH